VCVCVCNLLRQHVLIGLCGCAVVSGHQVEPGLGGHYV
jgi:hypothetical protein